MEESGPTAALVPADLRRSFRREVRDPSEIRALLQRVRDESVALQSGFDTRGRPREARLSEIWSNKLLLVGAGVRPGHPPPLSFSFALDGAVYFFAADRVAGAPCEVGLPAALYEAERRDLDRLDTARGPTHVHCVAPSGEVVRAVVANTSMGGLGLTVPRPEVERLGSDFRIRSLLRGEIGGELVGNVRHTAPDPARPGWVRLGLRVSSVESRGSLAVETRESILGDRLGPPLWARPRRSDGRHRRESPHPVELVRYPNATGRELCGIVDRVGDSVGALAVVLPPAWGKTKEALSGLAQALVQTFESAGEPLVVVRFDGTNRTGESYRDPVGSEPGHEYAGFRFSEAVTDIVSTLNFLEDDPSFGCREFILVTHSLGSVEGRRAVSVDPRFVGWVSVAGVPDLQSGLRAVSGGVDYAAGLAKGVEFGVQELVGVHTDMDRTGRDALGAKLVFAEDARQDMARIRVPVSWLHGRHDGWIDVERAKRLLGAGDADNRKLILIPSGHRMRTSRSAFDTFRLVAEEVAEIGLGRRLRTSLDRSRVVRASKAESERLQEDRVDLLAFWREYLLGRDGRLGIELLSKTSAYQQLIAIQLDRLELGPSQRVLDLGSGLAEFTVFAAGQRALPPGLLVVSVDLVHEALAKGAERATAAGVGSRSAAARVDLAAGGWLPFESESVDRALSALVLSYLPSPERFVSEAFRVLRSGGVFVLSSLRRDADISVIYREAREELVPDRVRSLFDCESLSGFEASQQEFLNEAARLIDFEETGRFRFWDPVELSALLRGAGFVQVSTESALGVPPQAIVVAARKP